MKRLLTLLLLASVVAAAPATAADPVSQTYNAPVDRVWTIAEAVLKQLGWDIESKDRSVGMIRTESRRLEGEDYGVYAKGTRHRLILHLKAAGENRTTVSVDRETFRRERILWIDKDEPANVGGGTEVQKTVLAAIGKAL
jgi:uncharacterized lipoprotein